MKIISAEETKKLLTPFNGGWAFLEHDKRDYLTDSKQIPFTVKQIENILYDLNTRFPLHWAKDYPIYIMPYRLRLWQPNGYGWDVNTYEGRAYDTHFILGTRQTGELPDVVITHELGHVLTYLLLDRNYEDHIHTPKFLEYINLRNLDPVVYGFQSDWENRVWEIFAEDFRYLFGSVKAKSEVFTPFDGKSLPDPPPPGEEIRKWMLSLVETKSESVINNKFTDVTNGRWSYQAIDWCANNGLVNGFEDGSFKPSDNLTREQLSVAMYRLGSMVGMSKV